MTYANTSNLCFYADELAGLEFYFFSPFKLARAIYLGTDNKNPIELLTINHEMDEYNLRRCVS
jgi:hypothetical protein